MSRIALRLVAALLPGLAAVAYAADPHMDLSLLPDGCAACHEGHGKADSPMLPGTQGELCLSCHDSLAKKDRAVLEGKLARHAAPPLLGSILSKPFVHPVSDWAFTRDELGVVACSSCHTPHRGGWNFDSTDAPSGLQKQSTRDPRRAEHELCGSCHGTAGRSLASTRNIGRLFSPSSRSYHPIEAPAAESSNSVFASLSGREINCTDCHGNSDPNGARGPHGSDVHHILRAEYNMLSGTPESPAAYALCYRCHDRNKLLNSQAMPWHRDHIVEVRAACAVCHDPHGSLDNRALIRLGTAAAADVAPSIATGRLAFVSSGPGSGTCYLACHGHDHAPESYGLLGGDEPLPFERTVAPGGQGASRGR